MMNQTYRGLFTGNIDVPLKTRCEYSCVVYRRVRLTVEGIDTASIAMSLAVCQHRAVSASVLIKTPQSRKALGSFYQQERGVMASK